MIWQFPYRFHISAGRSIDFLQIRQKYSKFFRCDCKREVHSSCIEQLSSTLVYSGVMKERQPKYAGQR